MNTTKKFKIPVSFECYGFITIEANSIDEAIAIFDATSDEIGLPLDWDYIDGSFHREDEEVCKDTNS